MPNSFNVHEDDLFKTCKDCHYSYGRWLEKCPENFVRNGCCTCTPICPIGMTMEKWQQNDKGKNNYVCMKVK